MLTAGLAAPALVFSVPEPCVLWSVAIHFTSVENMSAASSIILAPSPFAFWDSSRLPPDRCRGDAIAVAGEALHVYV
jgi:hypothetical protein